MRNQNKYQFATAKFYKAARKQQATASRKRFFVNLEEVDIETFANELHDGFLPSDSFAISWSSVKGDIFDVLPRLENKAHFDKKGFKKVLDKNKLFSKTALRRSQAKTVIAPVSDYAFLALGQEVVAESFEDDSKIILIDEQVFAQTFEREDGNEELCNATGRMLIESDGDFWFEFEDSLGGLHYGK